MNQLLIDLDGGITHQFPTFIDAVRASVYDCGRPFKAVASDLDMSSSALSRKLNDNPDDRVHFPLERLPELIEATGDLRPVYWLCETFLADSEARRAQDVHRLRAMVGQIEPLLARLAEGGAP